MKGATLPRRQDRKAKEDKAILLMSSAAAGTFDVEHYSKFKSDLDRYLNDEDDPFLLSC